MVRNYICLHGLLLLYSFGAVCSKLASQYRFLSLTFCLYYSLAFLILAVYALCWQQLLKRIPLVTGYANKAAAVLWGLLWGKLFFREAITAGNVIGAIVIIFGIFLVVKADE